MIGIETRRRHRFRIGFADLDLAEAAHVEMRAHRRNELRQSQPATKRTCMCALARGGIALTGVGIAGAKREHFERVPSEDALGRREVGLAPAVVDLGPSGSPGSMSASARRTDCGIGAGASASTRMRPRASTIDAIAFARIVPGLASSPPQFPE
jgi:hypothetical protein